MTYRPDPKWPVEIPDAREPAAVLRIHYICAATGSAQYLDVDLRTTAAADLVMVSLGGTPIYTSAGARAAGVATVGGGVR